MLSHPLIVEAITAHFTPVCVHNNSKDDADARLLQQFEEPAWNNPVVRILDGARRDLAPRNDKGWTAARLLAQMVTALEAAKRPVPDWLRLLRDEEQGRNGETARALFAMA